MHYVSPEQAQGKVVDQRSDIFSLGVMLYQLLTSNRPFEGESNLTILSEIINAPPAPVKLSGSDTASGLHQSVNGCMEKNPADRLRKK